MDKSDTYKEFSSSSSDISKNFFWLNIFLSFSTFKQMWK